jgi:hypothetical protein
MNKRNWRFEDRLSLHHQGWWHHIPDDEDGDGPRNIGFFYSSDAADCPRRFYWILSPRKLQIVHDDDSSATFHSLKSVKKHQDRPLYHVICAEFQKNQLIIIIWSGVLGEISKEEKLNLQMQSEAETVKMQTWKLLGWLCRRWDEKRTS